MRGHACIGWHGSSYVFAIGVRILTMEAVYDYILSFGSPPCHPSLTPFYSSGAGLWANHSDEKLIHHMGGLW